MLTPISAPDQSHPLLSSNEDEQDVPVITRPKRSREGLTVSTASIPMREGEVLYFKTEDASVVYMNPFGNPITGYFYITDYKVYFKGNEPEQSTIIQVCSIFICSSVDIYL